MPTPSRGGLAGFAGQYRVESYGPGVDAPSHDTLYGPLGQLRNGDVAVAPNLSGQYPLGSYVTINGQTYRVADYSYQSPGHPNKDTFEIWSDKGDMDLGYTKVASAPKPGSQSKATNPPYDPQAGQPTPTYSGGDPTVPPDNMTPTRIAAGGAPGDMELPGDFFGGIRLNGLSGMAQYMNTQRNPVNPPAGQVSTDQTARDAYLAAQRAKNGQPTVPPDNSTPTRLATGGAPGSLTGSQIFGGNGMGPVAASPFSLPSSSYNPSSPGQANVYVGDRLSSSQPYNAGSGNIPTAVAPVGQAQPPMTIGQKMQEGARNAGVASAPSGSIASGISGYASAANANAYYGFGSGGDPGSSAPGGISMGGGVFNMDFAQGGGGWITHSIVTMSG